MKESKDSNNLDESDPFASNENWEILPKDIPVEELVKKVNNKIEAFSREKYELSNEEKRRALESWKGGERKLKNIIHNSVGTEYDGRSNRGMAVKDYLASLNMQPIPSHIYVKKTEGFDLTEEQKEYIRANASTTPALTLAREIFDNVTLSGLSSEARVVAKFYDSLDMSLKLKESNIVETDYHPPKTHEQVMSRINQYVFEGIDKNTMNERQKQCVASLMKYMRVHQYLFTIRNLSDKTERELFESTFVRFCHDKPDLQEEEITLYISYCSDILNLHRLEKDLQLLI